MKQKVPMEKYFESLPHRQDELFERLNKATLYNRDGLPYNQFRKTLTPKWCMVWLHIAMGWMALVLSSAVIILLSKYSLGLQLLLVGAGSIVNGFILAYLQLFLHEAAHFNLLPNRRMNDFFCNLLVSGIIGMDVKNYRPIHLAHHRHLGTTMDTEISYFDPLNVKFIMESLLGIRVFKVLSIRRQRRQQLNEESDAKAQVIQKPYILIGGVAFHCTYVTLLLNFYQWPAMLAWIGGVVVFYPFFGALRQLLEHRKEHADPDLDYTIVAHGAVHRLFGDGLLASTLGGAGFNRHLLHHWDPQVSYTQLHELEDYLMDSKDRAYLQERQTTYWKTFWRLFERA